MNNNKKGISAVVATVLIILITVAAITIIWAAVIPMIKDNLQGGQVCLDAVSQVSIVSEGYTCIKEAQCWNGSVYNDDEEADCTDTGEVWHENISLQIGRDAGDFDLADIQVLVSIDGSTTSKRLVEDYGVTDLPQANEEKVFVINGTDFANADKVEIAPIVSVGNTEEPCGTSSSAELNMCA